MIIHSKFGDNVDLIAHRELGDSKHATELLAGNPHLHKLAIDMPVRTEITLPKIEQQAAKATTQTKIF